MSVVPVAYRRWIEFWHGADDVGVSRQPGSETKAVVKEERSPVVVAEAPAPVTSDLTEVDDILRDAEPIDPLPGDEDDIFPIPDDAYALSSSQEETSKKTLWLSDNTEPPVASKPQDDDWYYILEETEIVVGSSVSDEYVPVDEDSDFSVSAPPSYAQSDTRGTPPESELKDVESWIEEPPSADVEFSGVVHSGGEEDIVDAQRSEVSPPEVQAALADESRDRVIVASAVSFEDEEEMMDETTSPSLKAVSRSSDAEISTELVMSASPEDAVYDDRDAVESGLAISSTVEDTEVDFPPELSIHRASESETEIEEVLFEDISPPSDAITSNMAPLSGEAPGDAQLDHTERSFLEGPAPSSAPTQTEETTDVLATKTTESEATAPSRATEVVSSSFPGSASPSTSDASTMVQKERRHFRHSSLVSEVGANSSEWSHRMTATSDGRHDLSDGNNPSGFLHRTLWFYMGWGLCLSVFLLAAVLVLFYVYRRRKRQHVTPQSAVVIAQEESSSDADSVVPDMDLPTGRTDTDQLLEEEDIDKRQTTATARRDLDSASGRSPRSPRRLRFAGMHFSFKSVEAVRGSDILTGPLSFISRVVERIKDFVLTRTRKDDAGRDGLRS